jgi:NADH dehydrogenase
MRRQARLPVALFGRVRREEEMDYGIVTVFGGAGFYGRYVVRALARRGARVRVACRRPDEAMRCKPMGDVGQIVPVAANIRDDASVAAAVAGADAVVNLVAVLYERGRQTFEAVHHQGASRIAHTAAAAGVRRLVHVSAIGADRHARADYARTKGEGEDAVRQAFPRATIVRPSILFGPEDDFFNRFAAMARLSPALPLIGGGQTRFQPVYVCDAAAAVAAALADPAAMGRIYELGGPRVYTFKELMERLLQEIGRRRLLVPVPFWLATAQAWFLEWLPVPPLTRDQVRLLRQDNVVSPGAAGLADLGITPTALDVILPTYLARYRRGGRRDASPPSILQV